MNSRINFQGLNKNSGLQYILAVLSAKLKKKNIPIKKMYKYTMIH